MFNCITNEGENLPMKSTVIHVRINSDEKEKLELKAQENGKTVSEYLRTIAVSDQQHDWQKLKESLTAIEKNLKSQASINQKILESTTITNKILHFLAATIYQIKYLVLKFTNVFLVSFKEKIPAETAVPNQKELDQYAAEHLQQMDEATSRSLQ